ncbi:MULTISPECIES: copper resistance CopC family protein [unclassified Blastococcus]
MPVSARRPALLLAAVLAAAALLLAAPAPAAAHTGLESTDPAADSTVTTAPAALTLTFGGRVLGADVTVTGPDGDAATGAAAVEGAVVRVPVTLTAAGRYDVAWTVTGSDGHPLDGTFGFDFAPPAPPTSAAPPPSSAAPTPTIEPTAPAEQTDPAVDVTETAATDEGTPGWVLPVAAVAVLAVGVTAALLLRRRRG